jgi:hypothetical protein
MLKPTLFTYVLVVIGLTLLLILLGYAQVLMVTDPHGEATRDLLIGKGEDWRDQSHFATSYGMAWADLIFWFPLLVIGTVGVLRGRAWGYVLWAASGAISVYINILLWFSEKAYVYPSYGALAYYTYYWGIFVYWGLAVVAYSALRLGRRTVKLGG